MGPGKLRSSYIQWESLQVLSQTLKTLSYPQFEKFMINWSQVNTMVAVSQTDLVRFHKGGQLYDSVITINRDYHPALSHCYLVLLDK